MQNQLPTHTLTSNRVDIASVIIKQIITPVEAQKLT
jgi:hypothetical protein